MKDSTLQEIRERAADDILSLVEEHVRLKRSGRYYKGKCPFHEENTASFTVTPGKGMFKCFGCGEGGDAITFLQDINSWDFWKTIEFLADRYGVQLDHQAQKQRKSYRERMEKLLPGIIEAKADIRRKENVILCFEPDLFQEAARHFDLPVLYVKGTFRAKQAAILAKYTDEVTLFTNGLPAKKQMAYIRKALSQKLYVKCLYHSEFGGFSTLIPWIDYAVRLKVEPEQLKPLITQCLISIPDKLTYNIYLRRFSKKWTQQFEPEEA